MSLTSHLKQLSFKELLKTMFRVGSDGELANRAVLADAGLALGVTNMGEVNNPVDANATPPAGQSQTFSATIKRATFQFSEVLAAKAPPDSGYHLYVVFGALDDADALNKLTTAGLRHVIPLGSSGDFPFPDAGGSLRMDFATDVATATDTKVSWEVTL